MTARCPSCASPDVTAVELPWVYDGVLFWFCACTHAWPAYGPGHPRVVAARRYIAEFRRGVETERARNASRLARGAMNLTTGASPDHPDVCGAASGPEEGLR